jgi:hypothetical protein
MRPVRHGDHYLLQGILWTGPGDLITAVHHVTNRQPQTAAQVAAGMIALEILGAEVAGHSAWSHHDSWVGPEGFLYVNVNVVSSSRAASIDDEVDVFLNARFSVSPKK